MSVRYVGVREGRHFFVASGMFPDIGLDILDIRSVGLNSVIADTTGDKFKIFSCDVCGKPVLKYLDFTGKVYCDIHTT